MNTNMKLILAVPAEDNRISAEYRLPIAHMSYKIGGDFHLVRSGLAMNARGGYLHFTDEEFPTPASASFCIEVQKECYARQYDGVFADFEGTLTEGKITLLNQLVKTFSGKKIKIYVPESYGNLVPGSMVLISSAVSGGSLQQRLTEACEKFGASRLVLDIQRVAMEFTLPSPSGSGRVLSPKEITQLMEEVSATPFFSRELCTHYFTYHNQGNYYFVLYDSASSIRQKIKTAEDLGIREGVFLYPEVADLLPEILK